MQWQKPPVENEGCARWRQVKAMRGVSEFAAVSSLWLEIGAQRRPYNRQIRTLLKMSIESLNGLNVEPV
jgi:hypothetical protein